MEQLQKLTGDILQLDEFVHLQEQKRDDVIKGRLTFGFKYLFLLYSRGKTFGWLSKYTSRQ